MMAYTVDSVHPVAAGNGRLISRTRQIEPLDLLKLLLANPEMPRIFWRSPHRGVTYAGLGVAASVTAEGDQRFELIQRQAQSIFSEAQIEDVDPSLEPRFFGGFAFLPGVSTGIWSQFGDAQFVLPKLMFTQFPDGETWLTISAFENEAIDFDQPAYRTGRHPRSRGQLVKRTLATDQVHWQAMVTEAIRQIKSGELDKVVLARALDLQFSASPEVVRALTRLEPNYQDCHLFLLQPVEQSSFFGATPELLLDKSYLELRSAALAGTRPRGQSPLADEVLADDLFLSQKERQEHEFVVKALQEYLEPYVTEVAAPAEPEILRLKSIQHLYTPMQARLEQDTHILQLVRELHPTPALGGYPRSAAMKAIMGVEAEARGWYASPVGWFDRYGDGTFAVAIRSAVAQNESVRLYAGAGIVAKSDWQAEWAETQLKFKPLAYGLGVEL